jgi:Conserved domain frequently associated with peptide methionine sulfoxide reductase
MVKRVEKTDAEWKEKLTPEQFRVCRGKNTEPLAKVFNSAELSL